VKYELRWTGEILQPHEVDNRSLAFRLDRIEWLNRLVQLDLIRETFQRLADSELTPVKTDRIPAARPIIMGLRELRRSYRRMSDQLTLWRHLTSNLSLLEAETHLRDDKAKPYTIDRGD